MKSAIQPIKQSLSPEDKIYLSRMFSMKDTFSKHQADGNEEGLFIIYGESAARNLEATLSILDFLEEQNDEKSDNNPRQTHMYWTKNSDKYVDEENIDNEYHFFDIDSLFESVRELAYSSPIPFVYMDEIDRGNQIIRADSLAHSGATVFLSVLASNFEEVIKNFGISYPNENISRMVIGSISTNETGLSHIF